MFTIENYFEKVKEIRFASLPMKLKKGYAYLKEATENYTTLDYYYTYDVIKKTVNDYLVALNKNIETGYTKPNQQVLTPDENKAREIARKLIWNYVQNGKTIDQLKTLGLGQKVKEYSAAIRGNKIYVERMGEFLVDFSFPLQSIYNEVLPEIVPDAKSVPKKASPEPVKESGQVNLVERIEEEVKFIKRYAIMHGKEKPEGQILNFINALQKAILDKRIRKHSTYKHEIEYIQTNLVTLYNKLQKIPNPEKRIAEIRIDKKVLEKFLSIAGSEKIRLSVNYLKRYIGIQGKNITKEKAVRLIELIKKAVEKRKIISNDPYAQRLTTVYSSLVKFINGGKKTDTLEIHPGVLNGINKALDGLEIDEEELGCDCEKKKDSELNGTDIKEQNDEQPENTVMNSKDFSKMKFETLGFTGKWLKLIGDPCEGFSAMIFGRPKMGKSYLAIEFAGYLARHHGNTLYVAKEEALNKTLQDKLEDTKAAHKCLFVSDHLPEDLTPYQYIFLDSINSLKLSPVDLTDLKKQNPGTSIIEVHQVTKEGKHRGSMEHQHNVDVIIEIPEKGKAIQYGRFNQGSEMEIFEN
jgi:hypothetical protein